MRRDLYAVGVAQGSRGPRGRGPSSLDAIGVVRVVVASSAGTLTSTSAPSTTRPSCRPGTGEAGRRRRGTPRPRAATRPGPRGTSAGTTSPCTGRRRLEVEPTGSWTRGQGCVAAEGGGTKGQRASPSERREDPRRADATGGADGVRRNISRTVRTPRAKSRPPRPLALRPDSFDVALGD